MIEKFSDEELLMWETFQDPVALSECLFDDFDNLRSFEEDKFGHVRLGQLPLLSYEYLIDDENPDLSERENFRLREGAGNIWCNGGRLFGKSLIVEIIDLMITFLFYEGKSVGFTSYDHLHIKGILEKVIIGVENHPMYDFLSPKVNRNPYRIELTNGCVLEGINMNLAGKRPGASFLQKHFHKLFVEENTFETEEVNKQRVDSVSEKGCVIRSAGMTTFTRYSPIGKIFYDLEMTSWVCNLPQTINPLWDEKKKQKAIKKHSGENSVGYRVFVEGEVVESGISVFDMERIRPNYLEKEIKHFEITKNTFHDFKNILIVEKPENADRIFICADIGESAPTEIIILSCVNDTYRYLYNITVYDLIDKEQFKIFEWLGNKLGANFIGIECTEGSIDKNEFVLLKVKDKVELVRAKNLDLVFKKCKKVLVPTYNGGRLEWKNSQLYKHLYKGRMKKIVLYPGNYGVKVTPNHSMMVYTEKGLIEREMNKLRIGDWVVVPKNLNLPKNKYQVLEYEDKKNNQFSVTETKKIKLDKKLAYLLGWAVAEGSSKTTNYSLSLGNDRKKCEELLELSRGIFNFKSGYINESDRIGKHFFSKGRKCEYKQKGYCVVIGGGKGILKFFSSLCGVHAHNKKIPSSIFNSPNNVQDEFIRGLVEGDGHIRNRYKSTERSLHVVSEELCLGLITLLRMRGKFPSYYCVNDKDYGKQHFVTWNEKPMLQRWLGIPNRILGIRKWKNGGNGKSYSMKSLLHERVSKLKMERFNELLNMDWCFHRIKKIEEYEYDDYVYDLMVEDNNTFVTGIGNVLVHNTGRAIYRRLEEVFPKENLVWYAGTEKIVVGFEKDENDKVIFKKGKAVEKEEFMSEWSVKRLKDLFYDKKIVSPKDFKLDSQLNAVIATQSGNRTIYDVVSEEKHLFDAFKVFAIAEWKNGNNLTKSVKTEHYAGGV